MAPRDVAEIADSQPTVEGAGVRLYRAFGRPQLPRYDPFLLLDEMRSEDPREYVSGFPWHPHRGIETVTYLIRGRMEHGDSVGNEGVITSGDVQWMTAGSGIVHQEMPQPIEGTMEGFQLWVNLPSAHKMTDPKYRGVGSDEIPETRPQEGVQARVVAGTAEEVEGPISDLAVTTEFLDLTLEPHTAYTHGTDPDHTVFAYVVKGKALLTPEMEAVTQQTVRFQEGEKVKIETKADGARLLLVSGEPVREPVAWYGPIVMNTQAELEKAFQEYRDGTFIKSKP